VQHVVTQVIECRNLLFRYGNDVAERVKDARGEAELLRLGDDGGGLFGGGGFALSE